MPKRTPQETERFLALLKARNLLRYGEGFIEGLTGSTSWDPLRIGFARDEAKQDASSQMAILEEYRSQRLATYAEDRAQETVEWLVIVEGLLEERNLLLGLSIFLGFDVERYRSKYEQFVKAAEQLRNNGFISAEAHAELHNLMENPQAQPASESTPRTMN
jgi:phage terminase small subunit